MGAPVVRSHTRTVLSLLLEIATGRPFSSVVATPNTKSVWPMSGFPIGAPVVRSHTRIVLSQLPEIATGRPFSCAVATAHTVPAWPMRLRSAGAGVGAGVGSVETLVVSTGAPAPVGPVRAG